MFGKRKTAKEVRMPVTKYAHLRKQLLHGRPHVVNKGQKASGKGRPR